VPRVARRVRSLKVNLRELLSHRITRNLVQLPRCPKKQRNQLLLKRLNTLPRMHPQRDLKQSKSKQIENVKKKRS